MKDLLDFKSLKITIASPGQIRDRSFGEVTKPETINYRTLKAEKDGLFSENIFGPTKDYECYCGKYKRIRFKGVICDKCGVEVTQSKVRRERMGHITLACPVAHIWYVKGAPSKLSLVLDLSPKNLEAIVYFASYIVVEIDVSKKSTAQEKLNKDLQAKLEELDKNVKLAVKKLEAGLKAEVDDLKKKIKLSPKSREQVELQTQELELKNRHEQQKIRDNLVVEQGQLENIYKAVSELTKSVVPMKLLSEDEYYKLEEYGVSNFTTLGMGAEALLEILKKIDLDKLAASLREEVRKSIGQKHIKATKRLRIVEGMRIAALSPEWMILKILPVLPPDLRPMVQLPGGRFATSDLNDLYRRVINRNNRLNRLINLGAPEIILRNEKRMLQEAVDSLIDTNTRTNKRPGAGGGHVLRSLSDMLRGKQGRFRQNLLGKRVDYSGRSVIVVGPNLRLDQVGLPKEMALEMFKPFVLKEMIAKGLSSNVKGAKNVLDGRPSEVWDILEQIIEGHPILINRAPTLHRLGIQAFYPVLVEGNAIAIHPCICAGFNADFDGDQMAVHVVLSVKAQEEARSLMMAKENILKPSDASPVTLPNKEMALGSFYLTSPDHKLEKSDKVYSPHEVIHAYQVGKLELRRFVKVMIKGEIIETTAGRVMFNNILPENLQFLNESISGSVIKRIVMESFSRHDRETVVSLIDSIKNLGFWGATISSVSVGIFDNKIIEEKANMIHSAEGQVSEIDGNFRKGLITDAERRMLTQEIWIKITEEVFKKTWSEFALDNPVRIIVDAGGARATSEQIKQLSGMRGLTVDPTGKIVELPTKSNYREGLSIFEYFTSARGARKGVADRALKTADAGYLTRRLVDVAHDVIIRTADCETREGLELEVPANFNSARVRFLGRKTINNITDPKHRKIVVAAGSSITETDIQNLLKLGVNSILVRSPLTCQANYGLCQACYGMDMSTTKHVNIGTPVGVIAAQAIGEPGTQLTMRTFHTGGIVGMDITQGLPRVEELFEARTPKNSSPLSELAGKVTIDQTDMGIKIKIRATQKPHEEREYIVPVTASLLVEDGQLISAGSALVAGHLDIREILKVKGVREAQRYIVDEVRLVYESQGVPINEKHFEVIVRKMSDKVKIDSQGDTNLLPGEVVDKIKFEDENVRVLAGGGEPATGEVVILGITRASLQTESFLSAASFQETTTVLADAAIQGKVDRLVGLKENVIIGRLIPTNPERATIEI